MGIFINLAVSKSVTQEEWTSAYEESLKMADALNLSEVREMMIHGVKVTCLTKTKERDLPAWPDGTSRGWRADGDYNFLTVCESNGMRRDIRYTPKPDAVDPLLALSRLQDCNKQEEDPWIDDFVEFGGGKTQGEPQHMSLLAIACMFEDRLKGRALVYGDISRGQCRRATEIANKILDRPVDVPDCCDAARFFERIRNFPTDADKFNALDVYYLGAKDAAYGDFLRRHFPEDVLDQYWAERFRDMSVNFTGYKRIYREYLTQGFELDKLCRFSVMEDRDGNDLTEKFVRTIMESELYIPEKDCKDRLELNTDEPGTYGIASLFAQFVFSGARNPRVDRYISLDEIRRTLKEELGSRCDVDGIIDGYLAEKKEKEASGEKSDADLFSERIETEADQIEKEQDEYAISSYRALLFYETGDSISPGVLKNIVNLHEFCGDLLEKHPEEFQEFIDSGLEEKYAFLARRAPAFGIRDKDWEKIFTDIEEHPDSCTRYWAASNIEVTTINIRKEIQAYLLNDALYQDLIRGKLTEPEDE